MTLKPPNIIETDTIVAAATPPGAGGVAVLRLSGSNAREIADRLAGPLPEPRHAVLRSFRDADGRPLDQGLVLRFDAPASFTGEDVIELQGHGSPVVIKALLGAAVALGARRAEPGEFSRRAFMNDRMDLAQAEAIADLVTSGTEQAARAALRSMTGQFSAAVHRLEAELTELRVYVEAAIDFPDEDIDFLADSALSERLDACDHRFAELLDRAHAGRLLHDGLEIVIAGPPNAGKSSLLNQLSGADSAIVTEVAGTTRDVLRERIDLDGLPVEIIDTAGLRESPDRIEAEGIRRARAALERADAVLWVIDAQTHDNNGGLAEAAPGAPDLPEGTPQLMVRNKIDLTGDDAGLRDGVLYLSAATGEGVDALGPALKALMGVDERTLPDTGALSARERHIEALLRSRERFQAGVAAREQSAAGEILAEELRLAADELGDITGRMTSDALLGRIFSSFCIGK